MSFVGTPNALGEHRGLNRDWMRQARAVAMLMLLLMGIPGVARAQAAQTEWRFAYEGSLSGVAVGSGTVAVSLLEGAYRIELDVRTYGIANVFFPLTLQSVAEGHRPAGSGFASYRSGSRYRGRDTTILLEWSPERALITRRAEPAVDASDRKFVPDAAIVGTVDALAAGLVISEAIVGGAGCDQRVPIFDGRRRYNAVLTPDTAEAPSDPSLTGALRCRFSQERIAGFRKEQPVTVDERDLTRIWLMAPSPGSPVIPMRIESKTNLGTFLIRLVPPPTR